MKISKDEKQGKAILRCEGRLDATTSPVLENQMNTLFEGDQKEIFIDFSKIDYLSSAGMRVLLSMTKRLKTGEGMLGIFAIHDDVMEIIRMAGFENILNIYPDENQAIPSA